MLINETAFKIPTAGILGLIGITSSQAMRNIPIYSDEWTASASGHGNAIPGITK